MGGELVVDQARDRLVGGEPVAVAAAEHAVAQPGEGIPRQVAVEPVDEAGGIIGRCAVVRGAEDHQPALLRQLADIVIERREFGRKTVDLGEVGDTGGEILGGAKVGAVEHEQRRIVSGARPGARRRRGRCCGAYRTRDHNVALAVGLGRTLILKPSGLIVSVSLRRIW